MSLEEINKNWTALGEEDPLWVVLTDPAKKGNRWKEDEFFETGKREVENIFEKLRESGISVHHGKALDFGCGVGRLTQALAARFESVDGVDISDSMIRSAKKFNRFPNKANYHVNVREDLGSFPTGEYDFICSMIAIQHIPQNYQRHYIEDFMRVLKPGGVAYFQTIHFKGWRSIVPDFVVEFYRKLKNKGKPFIPMFGIQPDRIRQIVTHFGGKVEKHNCFPYSGYESRIVNDVFIIRKLRNPRHL
jgi:2-polyprenyl-3-methyl-5-hydroxy-6-metoxy-1,4-benzoquinol methylase